MKKNIKKAIAGMLLGTVAVASVFSSNSVYKDSSKVKAEEVTSNKYMRDTQLSVNAFYLL